MNTHSTFEEWLDIALAGLAPRIRERLHAEYESHMLDMREAGESDWAIQNAFGDPVTLNGELKNRYLTAKEADELEAKSRQWRMLTPWTPLAIGASGVLITLIVHQWQGNHPPTFWWLPLFISMLGTAWLVYVRQTLPARRQALHGFNLLIIFPLAESFAFRQMASTDWLAALFIPVFAASSLFGLEWGLRGNSLYRKLLAEEGETLLIRR